MVTSVPAVSDLAVSAEHLGRHQRGRRHVGAARVPGELAEREPEAVGGEQRDRRALDLDPDAGEHRQHVVAAGGGDRLGDRVRRTGRCGTVPVACGHRRAASGSPRPAASAG